MALVNLALGLLGARLHPHPTRSALALNCFSFFVAGFAFTSFLKRLARYIVTPAAINLEKVVKATGGKFTGQLQVEMSVKRGEKTFLFHVGPGAVWLNGELETCFQYAEPMPHEEAIASAVLLLKNDPDIFFDWLHRNGPRLNSSRKWSCT